MQRKSFFVGCGCAAALTPVHAEARTFDPNAAPSRQEAKLLADVSSELALAGDAVALDGDTALVGAYQTGIGGQDPVGAVFVHVRTGDTWTPQARLIPEPAATFELFGTTVALDGDIAAVSSAVESNDPALVPAVRLFTRTGTQWAQTAKIQPSDLAFGSGFGRSLALAGDTLLVGDPRDSERAPQAGAIHVFTRVDDVWSPTGKLSADDASDGQYFGSRLAVDGDTLLVGVSSDAEAGEKAGAVIVFGRTDGQWSERQKLLPTATRAFQYFGHELALEGDLAVIGTCVRDEAFGDVIETAAEVFVRTDAGWVLHAGLAPASPPTLKNYCNSVAIDDGVIVMGMPEIDDPEENWGGAYLFSWDGESWVERATVLVSDDASQDGSRLAGAAVAVSGDTILLGAPADDELFEQAGAAFVFRINAPPSQPIEPASGEGCGCRARPNPTATSPLLLLGLAWVSRRRRGQLPRGA